MVVQWQCLWLPKRGNSAEEYEDAFTGDGGVGRFAVADGATESYGSASWARLLVEEFIRTPLWRWRQWGKWLPGLQERWVADFDSAALPWYATAKLHEGAFAAFLGLSLEKPAWWWWGKSRWRAVAVGDSCLFQIRAGCLHAKFPIQQAEEFGNHPWLLGSRDAVAEVGAGKVTWAEGDGRSGDLLLLLTDALAQWFLRQHEGNQKPWEALAAILTAAAPEEHFAAWVEAQRDQKELKNDDVTLLAVRL